MAWLFEALELEQDKEAREAVDDVLRGLLGIDEAAGCPEVWGAIKALPDDDRAALPPRVAEVLGE